jgi:uncharacterized membrane protein
MTDREAPETPRQQAIFTAERAKAFVDAVVAIAMTLLILPLLESVADIARGDTGLYADDWLDAHNSQIVTFLLSFAIIAMFWIGHHRMFSRVENVSIPLLWLMVAWMVTIVWLPVPTAMLGQLRPSPLLYALYIGSMVLTALMTLLVRLMLRANPSLHDIPPVNMRRGLMVEVVLVVLFGGALALAELTPLGYWSMLLLVLTAPVQRILGRVLRIDRPGDADG